MIVQAGPAGRFVKALLGHELLDTVYRAFVRYHLTLCPPDNDTLAIVNAYGIAMVSLISALPDSSAPTDERLDRPPMWHTISKNQSANDVLVPRQQQQAAAAGPVSDTVTTPPSHTGADDAGAWPASISPSTGITRAQALDLFLYFVKPADGLAFVHMQDLNRAEEQRRAALQLLITFYGCNCNPTIADADSATFYCRFHCKAFKDAYACENVGLSKQHLAALQALAKHKVRSHTAVMYLGYTPAFTCDRNRCMHDGITHLLLLATWLRQH